MVRIIYGLKYRNTARVAKVSQNLSPVFRRHNISCVLVIGVVVCVIFVFNVLTQVPDLDSRPQILETLQHAAIIVFCYNRPHYLNQTLHSLASLKGLQKFTVYVSQEGNDPGVKKVIRQCRKRFQNARKFEHWIKPLRTRRVVKKWQGPTAWIAQHYKWGLTRLFSKGHTHAIVIEDDLLFSPDFLTYFTETAWLLDADPTLWCISSWNDNCYGQHDWDVRRLFRNSHFPGLGWMIKKEMWSEMQHYWIEWGNWDENLRSLPITLSRQRDCICPEVSRTRNIGAVGVNMDSGWFNESFGSLVWAKEQVIDYGDLSYLLKDNYIASIIHLLKDAIPWSISNSTCTLSYPEYNKTYLVEFTNTTWPYTSKCLKMWHDGPIRGHYKNIAIIPSNGAKILIADRDKCPFINTSFK